MTDAADSRGRMHPIIVECSMYPRDRDLFPGEITRTNETYFAMDREAEDYEERCRCCKATDPHQIFGPAAVPFANFYGTNQFKAYSCYHCGAVWSFLTRRAKLRSLLTFTIPHV